MEERYSMIMTTTNDKVIVKKIVKVLLDEKLAACVQVTPMESYYTWENEVVENNEYLILIKAKHSFYLDIERILLEVHNYSIPEIIQVPIEKGFSKYLQWIEDVSRK